MSGPRTISVKGRAGRARVGRTSTEVGEGRGTTGTIVAVPIGNGLSRAKSLEERDPGHVVRGVGMGTTRTRGVSTLGCVLR